jgi:transposase InsO family protein
LGVIGVLCDVVRRFENGASKDYRPGFFATRGAYGRNIYVNRELGLVVVLTSYLPTGSADGKRYVLIDRDPLYTEAFRRILGQGGVKVVRLPARSPNLNAFAERFVLSIKTECLDRLVPLGEAHLRRAILDYTNHYHEERNHQGLDNELIVPVEAANGVGKVNRRERLGGLLSFCYREAA